MANHIYPNLYKELKAFSIVSFQQLLNLQDSSPLMMKRKTKVKFGDGQRLTASAEHVPMFSILVGKNEGLIESFPEAKKCVEELKKTKHYRANAIGMKPTAFVGELADLTKSFIFKEAVFDSVYADFENFLYTGKTTYEICAPLRNFSMESDSISLGCDIRIIKMSEEQVAEMIDDLSFNSDPFQLIRLRYRIEVVYSMYEGVPGNVKDPHAVALSSLNNVLCLLRLFKEGDACLENYYYRPTSWAVSKGMGFGPSLFQSKCKLSSYELKKEEEENFINFWRKYKSLINKLPAHSFLFTAINRFNFAYSNERIEDRLIDYIIAFEALFLEEGENQELSYRLSLRTAVLLSPDESNGNEVFENMRIAYRLRSGVVHGKEYKREREKIESKLSGINNFLVLIERYLRLSIQKYLDFVDKGSTVTQKSIIKNLDAKILSK